MTARSVTPFRLGGEVKRLSSHGGRLAETFLRSQLETAKTYDRIAGYFRSSIFEIMGEEIERIDKVRIIANSDVDVRDLYASRESGVASTFANAAIFGAFADSDVVIDAHLHRDRYARLHALLTSGKLEVKVVASDDAPFLHGKAGVITSRDGAKTSFMGSVNETLNGWARNYEIVWEDSSPDGVAWVQSEFDDLWRIGIPLPDLVIDEIKRLSERRQVKLEFLQAKPQSLAPAAIVESPLYKSGQNLEPWQSAFVDEFLRHRDVYEKARLILADEVGVGKTLSLAGAALVTALLGDGPVLILVPSTLCEQWQVEIKDRLGIPSGRWDQKKKRWVSPDGRLIKGSGVSDVAQCPYAIGIVSTGLIVQNSEEANLLLSRKHYGLVILDEAHKGRKREDQDGTRHHQKLSEFMTKMAGKARHMILSTATPIQTKAQDLWDLLETIATDTDFVLGNNQSPWRDAERVVKIINGETRIESLVEGWPLLVNPIPPDTADEWMGRIREELDVKGRWTSDAFSDEIGPYRAKAEDIVTAHEGGIGFFQRENPLVRHIILRKRRDLEEQGLIPKIRVNVHPHASQADILPPDIFDRHLLGIHTTTVFQDAYRSAEAFTAEYGKRSKAAGFMKNLLLQRICSSQAAGIATAQALIESRNLEDDDDDDLTKVDLVDKEIRHLRDIVDILKGAQDPKLRAIKWLLDDGGMRGFGGWHRAGCIIFSQYYETARWIAGELAQDHSTQAPIGLYAGHGKSALYKDGLPQTIDRETIKELVKKRALKILVATDAACEGLNLQTLGTLINVDLPWNPTRLEQRIGRIKRYGQVRKEVDMANLGYLGTVDEKVLQVLSGRLADIHEILGSVPETINSEWIDNINAMTIEQARHIRPQKAFDPFTQRYSRDLKGAGGHWRATTEVLSKEEVEDVLSRGWSEKSKRS